MTITHDLKCGRLGNQLFQIAAVLHIASLNNATPLLPEWNMAKYIQGGGMFSKRNHTTVKSNEIFEDRYQYSELRFKDEEDIQLVGYYQSYKYAEQVENIMRWILHPTIKLQSMIDDISQCLPDEYISMHVRRGDYLNHPGCLPLPSLSYYSNCLKLLPNMPIVVFSDDPDWCKSEVKFENRTVIIHGRKDSDFNSSVNDLVDMLVMSRGKYFALSASTFAWWAAWLSINNDKKIIYPAKWIK